MFDKPVRPIIYPLKNGGLFICSRRPAHAVCKSTYMLGKDPQHGRDICGTALLSHEMQDCLLIVVLLRWHSATLLNQESDKLNIDLKL